ncbi:MAG: M48 family metalloprotease [Christensenellales bacterium]
MYYFTFVKTLFYKRNLPVLLYQILNVAITFYIFYILKLVEPQWASGLIGIGVFIVGQVISFSPIGEFMMRIINGGSNIKDLKDADRMLRLFEEVKQKAIEKGYEVPKKIKLYYVSDSSVNACACGKRTVIINSGLVECNDEVVKAVLAHELGHIVNCDGFKLQSVVVGNIVVAIAYFILKLIAMGIVMIANIFSEGLANFLYIVVISFFMTAIQLVWQFIGIVLVSLSMRQCEYKADEMAKDLGYKEGLVALLEFYMTQEKSRSLYERLVATHPVMEKRLSNINSAA